MSILEDLYRLPGHHFQTIYADPPWEFITRSPKGKGRSAEQHYKCLSLAEIKALPVARIAAKDCVLLMWVTDPCLRLGMDVLEAWGFKYKTVGFYWVKTNKDGVTPSTGQGFWTRANPEQCLFASRGHPKRLFKDVARLVISKRREHSRKPDEMYEKIERLIPGPYIELFGRTERPGWESAGDEVGKFDAVTTCAVRSRPAAARPLLLET